MQAGRNEPCPCGSGKKYKKCCHNKDQASTGWVPAPGSVASQPEPSSTEMLKQQEVDGIARLPHVGQIEQPSPAPKLPDPIRERADHIWNEFEERDTDGKIALYLETLNDPEVMNGEMAYSLLAPLRTAELQQGNRARISELIAELQKKRPEAYAEEAPIFLLWNLLDAIAEGRHVALPMIARQLAQDADNHFETFRQAEQILQYHGLLSVLQESYRVAWPVVKLSKEIFGFALTNVMNVAADMEIFAYLEQTNSPDADDPGLLERLQLFVAKPRILYIREFISDLTGTHGKEWKLEDFAAKPSQKKRRPKDDEEDLEDENSTAEGADNLSRLISQFVGYLRQEEGVPYARGEQVRHELFSYLTGRLDGRFDPRPSMLELARNPHKKLPKPPRPLHPLCPDRITLEACMAGMMRMLQDDKILAATLFEAIPAWLRFLKARGLIDEVVQKQVVNQLLPLVPTLEEYWKPFLDDPTPYRRAQAWPQDAARRTLDGPA